MNDFHAVYSISIILNQSTNNIFESSLNLKNILRHLQVLSTPPGVKCNDGKTAPSFNFYKTNLMNAPESEKWKPRVLNEGVQRSRGGKYGSPFLYNQITKTVSFCRWSSQCQNLTQINPEAGIIFRWS